MSNLSKEQMAETLRKAGLPAKVKDGKIIIKK